ncbi:MAG TPA: hypothetical protein VN616_06135 [Puia sp.]|nr:hypothetical protein [Puia sp.]
MSTNRESDAADQMNLSALKYLGISLLVGFFRFLGFSGYVMRRRRFFLLACCIVGLGLGLFYYYVAQLKVYQASMVVASNYLTNKDFGGVMNGLSFLAKTRSADKLSADLHLPRSITSNILSIEAGNMEGIALQSDTSNKIGQPFQINFLIASRNDITDSLEAAMIEYLNDLPYLHALATTQKISDSLRLTQLQRDLAELDSLKVSYNRFLGSSRASATVYSDAVNPAEIYEQTGELLDDLRDTRRRLDVDNSAVAVIDHIKIADTTKSKSLPILLAILVPGFFLAGLLLGLLMEARRRLLHQGRA